MKKRCAKAFRQGISSTRVMPRVIKKKLNKIRQELEKKGWTSYAKSYRK
jgi:hypothetical protein